ncbi:hypothetical protein BVX97_02685 [bacterium E08(2017)]|nr:hypothetical protein BVX97_02685 [bacterium E08(2017)]
MLQQNHREQLQGDKVMINAKRILLFFLLLVVGNGCRLSSREIFLRDINTSLLYGPFVYEAELFVELPKGYYCAACPESGEIATIQKLKSMFVSIDVDEYDVLKLADHLDKLCPVKSSINRVHIVASAHEYWTKEHSVLHDSADPFKPSELEKVQYVLRKPDLPKVSLKMDGVSMYEIIEEVCRQIPFYFEVRICEDKVVFKLLEPQKPS